MLTGISTLSIGDVNSLSQEYIDPPGFAWADLYKDIRRVCSSQMIFFLLHLSKVGIGVL